MYGQNANAMAIDRAFVYLIVTATTTTAAVNWVLYVCLALLEPITYCRTFITGELSFISSFQSAALRKNEKISVYKISVSV